MKRREAGFSFIEILVVMGIISVLVSMVVVLVPMIQEKAKQSKSVDNVKNMVTLMIADNPMAEPGKFPPVNGKNFVLWLVVTNQINRSEERNLETLFSPGDGEMKLDGVGKEAYKDLTKEALRAGPNEDLLKLTSYAGRRNKDREHKITSSDLEKGTVIICDDDVGALHHSKGLVVGYSNGSVKFMKWDELDVPPPEDEKNPTGILGDNSPNEQLKHMSSQN